MSATSSTPPAEAADGRAAVPGLYYAPLFDSMDADGKPVVDRPLVHRQDVWEIISYLKSAPVVLAARGFVKDLFAPEEEADIPLSFHSDGTWVWSAQATHYLRRWGTPPPPQLVKHIRANDYAVPEVGEAVRGLAGRVATGEAQPLPMQPYVERVISDDDQAYLARLSRKLESFDIAADRYGVLDVKPNAVVLEPFPDSDQWQIGHWDADLTPREWPVVYMKLSSAAAFLLGSLLLDDGLDAEEKEAAAHEAIPVGDQSAAAVTPATVTPPLPPVSPVVPATPAAVTPPLPVPAVPVQWAAPPPPPAWATPAPAPAPAPMAMPVPAPAITIAPLPGEPPLTLLATAQALTLAPGTELDRFGFPNGNLAYVPRTPFPNRSLPPDWSTRGYHVYRLQRPLPVLAGTTVPWFGQPGGGQACFLPASIETLLADGSLIEIGG